MAGVPNPRRAYVRRREQKRKKRAYIAILAAALIVLAGFVLFLILQDHLVFTAEGMRFVLSDEDKPKKTETAATVAAPDVTAGRPTGFFPRAEGAVSVRGNGRPPYGAGYIDAVYVSVEDFTCEEAAAYAAALYDDGVRSVVVDVKNESGRVNFTQKTIFSASAAALDGRLSEFISQCTYLGIRVTGRVCCFRDNDLPRRERDCAVLRAGDVYEDEAGISWLDPYVPDVRENLVELCRQAAALGVRELLLDDFSFLGEKPDADAVFSGSDDRVESLNELLSAIRGAADAGTVLSVTVYADVLGEGGSDSKGQNLAALEAVCGHLWIRCADEEELLGHARFARLQSQKLLDMLAFIYEGRYASASLYLE